MQPAASTPHPTPDPVLETQLFWERNKMPILIGIAAILVALAGYGALRYMKARKDAAAAAILAEAKLPETYQKLIAEYPSTPAAGSAYLMLAAEQRKSDKFDESNGTLQNFLSKNGKHSLAATAKMMIGANFESLGKTDEALEHYHRLAADHPKNFNAPLAMLAQVRLLKAKGNQDEARKVCETILTQYRESYASAEATQQLRQLKPAETPAPAPAAAAAAPGAEGAEGAAAPQDAASAPADVAASVPPVEASPAASAAATP